MKWRIGVFALSAIAVVVAAELEAKHEGFGSPLLYERTPTSYELVPNQHVVRLGQATTINALGVRSDAVRARAKSGVWRILVLGDSVANGGTQLDDTQTFASLTSRLLENAQCRNEILNASAGGWALSDEISWVERHGFLGAQTVVWAINYMDLDQSSSGPRLIDSNPAFPSHRPAAGLSEILFRYVLPALGLSGTTADNGSVSDGSFNERQFAINRAMVRSEAADLARQKIRLVVLYHDGPYPMPLARNKAETAFLSDLADQGIEVIRSPISSAPDHGSLYFDAIHPNRAGAERIAKFLSKTLLPLCPKTVNSQSIDPRIAE